MAIDVHVHCRGGEDAATILKNMDAAGLDRMVLFSSPPHRQEGAMTEKEPHKKVTDAIAELVKADPERLIGFAWIEPTLPDAMAAVDYAFGEKSLRGAKMMPNHWYPADERAQACYKRIEEHGKPILFHTGILWGTSDTSQHCRPAFFEIMLHYPKVRFAMGHMSWPWTDECFAVCGKFRARKGEWNSYADTTSGAPRIWKVDAFRKALSWLGDDHLIYGSDAVGTTSAEDLKESLDDERSMLREAGASEESIQRILHTNALRWLGIA